VPYDSHTKAHPDSFPITVATASRYLRDFGVRCTIEESRAFFGPDARRGRVDMLRRRLLGYSYPEACAARRQWRVSCDWPDGKEPHEVTCTLAFRWDGSRHWEPVCEGDA